MILLISRKISKEKFPWWAKIFLKTLFKVCLFKEINIFYGNIKYKGSKTNSEKNKFFNKIKCLKINSNHKMRQNKFLNEKLQSRRNLVIIC